MKKDQWGHWVEDDGRRITDPYGGLTFVVGSSDDFVCFDYAFREDKCILHATLNSETGHFIEDFGYVERDWQDSPQVAALVLVESALDWCAANDVRHSKSGWGQDPYYFVRAVMRSYLIHNSLWGNNPAELGFSDRQFRFGGKRINIWAGISRATKISKPGKNRA